MECVHRHFPTASLLLGADKPKMDIIGVGSLPIVLLTGFFTGGERYFKFPNVTI